MTPLLRTSLTWVAGALAGALMMAGGPSHATTTVLGVEDPVNGFVGDLVSPGSGYTVASDGEASFDPFGAGFDVSDGLNFSTIGAQWLQAPGSIWTSIGFQTWVLPADLTGIGCGKENATTCEPVGHFISNLPWSSGVIGTWLILEGPSGPISDEIVLFNKRGQANLLFYSDPSLPAPEPATIAVLGVGLLGLAVIRRRRG